MTQERAMNYEESILSGVIPLDSNPDRIIAAFRNLDYIFTRVKTELFSPNSLMLVKLALLCKNSSIALDESILVDSLQRLNIKDEQLVLLQELFHKSRTTEISEGKFRYIVSLFLQEREVELFQSKLNDAFTILKDGMHVGRRDLKGIAAAREYLVGSLYKLDQTFLGEVPHGNVRDDGKEVWSEYETRRDNPSAFAGIKTGFLSIDRITNGVIPGELCMIAGFSGQGKSNALINLIYDAATRQGKNVVVGVNEMLYRQYRTRLFIRHTCNARFGLPQGIPYSRFKMGAMNPIEEKAFQEVIKDFESNSDYGRVEVFQIPKGYGLDFISARMSALQSMFNIDLMCIDYLQLVGAPGRSQQKREYLDALIAETKQLALSFNRGKGVPIWTPWQINRSSFKEACQTGKYNLSCLSEAPEAERSSDLVIWLLRRDEEIARNEIKAGMVKYRDGILDEEFTLFEDFESYFIGDVKSTGENLPGSAPGSTSLF